MPRRGEARKFREMPEDSSTAPQPRDLRENKDLILVFGFVRERARGDPKWRGWWHPPNELLSRVEPSNRRYFTEGGVSSGVSDIIGDLPVKPYHGARFELKAEDGYLTPEQRAYLQNSRERGLAAEWCRGYHDMCLLIGNYIAGCYAPTPCPEFSQPWRPSA